MKPGAIFCLLLAAFSVPAAAAVSIETATGDWSNLPQLSQRGYDNFNEKMQAKLFEIAESQQCPSVVLKQGRLDFRISFAVQYAPDGSLSRIVMPKLDCAPAESVVGGALLEMMQAGDYAATGKSPQGWYRGGVGFSFAGNDARSPGIVAASQGTGASLDPNEIICEKVEKIGTRLSSSRVCMSRAQWAEQRRLTRQVIEAAQRTSCQEQDNSC